MSANHRRVFVVSSLTAAAIFIGMTLLLFLPRDPGRIDGLEPDRPYTSTGQGSTPPNDTISESPPTPGVTPENGSTGTPMPPTADPNLQHLPHGSCYVTVQLTDSAGAPVGDALVSLLAGRRLGESRTDARGEAHFPEIAAGTYTIQVAWANTPDLELSQALILEEAEERVVQLSLPRADLSIAGRVLDLSGGPLEGVELRAAASRPPLAERTELRFVSRSLSTAVSGGDGSYRIENLAPGDYVVSTVKTSQFPSVRRTVRAGVQSADFRLGGEHTYRLFGRVLSADGTAVPGAVVTALGLRASDVAADSGEYEIEVAVTELRRTLVIKVTREEFHTLQMHVQLDSFDDLGERELDLVVDPLGATVVVEGVVLDDADVPISGETVTLYSRRVNARLFARTDPSGHFAIENVPLADDYKVWIYPRSEYGDYTRQPVRIDEAFEPLEIRLERLRSGTIEGVMLTPNGTPVEDFEVLLRSTKAQGNSITLRGDAHGVFVATGVPAGVLLFETRSTPRLSVRGYTLEPDQTLPVRLILDWGEDELSGEVRGPDGQPVRGAKVNLLWNLRQEGVDYASFRSTVTDARGMYVFTELAPGDHRIHVLNGEFRGKQIAVQVGDGRPAPVIQLEEYR